MGGSKREGRTTAGNGKRRMKNFSCLACGNKVYFENVICVRCAHALGFDADTQVMSTLLADASDCTLYHRVNAHGPDMRYCANASYGVCNWLTPDGGSGLCRACNLNRTIPNLSESGNLQAWSDLERAKKRLVYSLLRFGLPFEAGASPQGPLTFNFVRSAMTGHLDGVITIDIMEADAVERERQRQQFGEPYRSLLGHLRHESGHYYWTVLISGTPLIEEFRTLFGDERPDYGTGIAQHYHAGPPADWSLRHVSAYASAHPWEDWAETWAHYLHMVDTLDTAEASGMEPRTAGLAFGAAWPFQTYDIYREETFAALLERWVPLTLAMNNLNRSMGHDDFYPVVLPDPAIAKLAFVHRAIRERQPLT
jgi:hypothetical protein